MLCFDLTVMDAVFPAAGRYGFEWSLLVLRDDIDMNLWSYGSSGVATIVA